MKTAAVSVQQALMAAALECQVVELPASTRSAAEAALAIGCREAEIAKSIVFQAANSGEAILVLASGHRHINEALIATAVGEPIKKADAEFVRRTTGFAIGGVPPLGHTQPITTYFDEQLLAFPCVWAAAGTPQAVFAVAPADLLRITHATALAVA